MPSRIVTLILDTALGAEAIAHARAGPTWLVQSERNATAALQARAQGLSITMLHAVGAAPTDWLLNHLDTVDQHHNEQSQVSPYVELRVIGAGLTPEIEAYLPLFGFCTWIPTASGFVASKASSIISNSDAY